jgi:hypothetical protein
LKWRISISEVGSRLENAREKRERAFSIALEHSD